MSTPVSLKTFEVIYTLPSNLVSEETGPSKSLNFHRFMRHSRDCHKQLLDFLSTASLLDETGACTLVANERKTVIECSDAVIAKIRSLPFVEKAEEMPGVAPRVRADQRRHPPSHG